MLPARHSRAHGGEAFDKGRSAGFTNKVKLAGLRANRALIAGAIIATGAALCGGFVSADSATAANESHAGLIATVGVRSVSADAPRAAPELDALGDGPVEANATSDVADALTATGLAESDLEPIFSRVILRLRARAQAKILGRRNLIEDARGRISSAERTRRRAGSTGSKQRATHAALNGNALGRFVPVEHEEALAPFHRALEDLLSRPELKSKVRIAAYGASHTQADIYAGYLRYYLQSRFGNGGVGFVPAGLRRTWSRRLGLKVTTKGFSVQHAQQKSAPRHGRFGLSGSAAVAGPHASLQIEPKKANDSHLAGSQYSLFFAAEPRGGELTVSFDDEVATPLSARAEAPEARYEKFVRPLGSHKVRIRTKGDGAVRLFGMVVERDQPGLVIDTLGIRGTRAANMLSWDEGIWTSQLLQRAPDLVTLAYGTNETTDRGQPIEEYESELRSVLSRLRNAVPAAGCVLIGPGDFPRSINDRWQTRPRLLQIIQTQRRVAPDFGCGFWDTYAFMGGPGSMERWVEARPALGAGDHVHFTKRGYVRMGMALADALMRAYDEKHLPLASRVVPQRSSLRRTVSAL